MNTIIEDKVEQLGQWFLDHQWLEKGKMTQHYYPYKKLFEPIWINGLKVKNRIVMGPMGNISMSDETGKPGSKMVKYFIERAKGGVGLITSGMIPVYPDDDPSIGDLDGTGIFPRIDKHRSVYAGWRDIVEGCHAYGARFFIQLSPGMGRVGNPECLAKKKKMPVSSSWNPNWYIPKLPCRPLSDGACKKIIKHTGQIAVDAKEAGIDGIYLHGHSGYLIEQMTDPAFNRRKRGRFANWQNFGLDLVREIRKRCGDSYPIHYRIDLSLALKETYGDILKTNPILKKFKNGRKLEMTLSYMEKLVEVGVDIFDVDLGGYENWWMPHPPNGMPPGVYLNLAQYVKAYFIKHNIRTHAGHQVPIIAVGKLGFPDLAEQALMENQCDMIMLARPLLADPYWPQKVYAGKVKEIIPCIGCHEGCLGQIAIGGHPQCAVNPRTAFEDIYQDDLKPATHIKKVAVIGAGPAGVIAACTAAKRGHEVTLYDANHKAGGQLLYGTAPKIKFELSNYMDYLNHEVESTSLNYNLTVRYNTPVKEGDLKEEKYDCLVTCTGTIPKIPDVKGINQGHVIRGDEFLKNKDLATKAKHIIIIGGSDVGCEIAYMLSYEMNKKVTIIEMEPYFMKNTCTSNRHFLIHHLAKKGVEMMNCTALKEVRSDSVLVNRNVSPTVPDPYVTWTPVLPDNVVNPLKKKLKQKDELKIVEGDLVILCTGVVPNDTLHEKCIKNRTAPEIVNIGDSFMVGRVLEAVKAGYAIGNSL